MSLAGRLRAAKQTLKHTETKVTTVGGITLKEDCLYNVCQVVSTGAPGFVLDLKPDLSLCMILPWLYLGSQDVAREPDILRQANISSVLNVATGVDNSLPQDFLLKNVELLDIPEQNITLVLDECLGFLDSRLSMGQSVLVHCNAGVSRSATVVIAFLMLRNNMDYAQISYAATEKYTDSLAGLPHPPLPPVISLPTSSPLPQPPRGPPPLARPVQYNLPGIRDRMKQRLVEMEEVSRRHGQDADRAVDDLVSSECEIERLESSIPGLAQKHRFYQDLRGYVTDFTDCFDEKVGSIAYLEERLYKMYAELRGKIRERRRQDVRDQADQLHSMTATNIALMMDPVQDAVRDFRVAEREGRRMRRRQARQARSEMRHNDGMSSDDEIPSTDKASLGKVRQDVENQARQVLDDVIEEFALLSNVQTRLSSWKLEDFSSYKEAYVSLCLPKLFSPLIRMQLLLWNPFVHEQKIEDQEWYRTLSTYGLQEGETMESLGTDPDRNLLSLCVERVLVPKLVGLVRSGYDPLSHSQTLRLVSLVSRLAADYPTLTPTSKHFRQLVTTVVDNIKESLDSDVYIPVYNKAQLDSTSSPHAAFSHRQFWTTYKLLRNILAWQGVLADGVLADLAIDRLINRYVLLSLRANPDISDAIDKSRQVVALLPPWWLNKGDQGELHRLAMFVKFLGVAGATNNLPRDALIEAARILKLLGDSQTSDSLRELL